MLPLKVKRVKSEEFVKSFIYDDKELFDRITCDNTSANCRKDFKPLHEKTWIGYFDGDVCKGLMSIDISTPIILNVHINIPKKFRGVNSFEIGSTLLKWVETNCDKKYIKLNAIIPSCYYDVVKFAQKNGFSIYGKDKNSYVKNGKLYHRYFMSKPIER